MVKTGSKYVGFALACASAAATCGFVAPAATSAVVSDFGFLTRLPSSPTITTCACVVSGAPPAPRMGARAGQLVRSLSLSPARSCGAIVEGDQRSSQCPPRFTRSMVVLMLIWPIVPSVRCSVTACCAVSPSCRIGPVLNEAAVTPRLAKAAWLTAVKSAGGLAVSRRIAAQSWCDQPARKELAVACGVADWPPLHPASASARIPAAPAEPPLSTRLVRTRRLTMAQRLVLLPTLLTELQARRRVDVKAHGPRILGPSRCSIYMSVEFLTGRRHF